jgi:xeroderma pigmentosum group C-complementing protein
MASDGRRRGGGKGKSAVFASTRGIRRSQRARAEDDGVPQIFKEMLAEEAASEHRPMKRRKVAGSALETKPLPDNSFDAQEGGRDSEGSPAPVGRLQTITDDSESSESEVEWEDVIVDDNATSSPIGPDHHEPSETLSLVINTKESPIQRAKTKKRPISTAERAMRLDIHKMHVMYLLYHGFYRNSWCNDLKTQVHIFQNAVSAQV